MSPTRVLIVDNYDSFSHNLAHLFVGVAEEVVVIPNDRIDAPGLETLNPTHIVLSPGPGRPERIEDVGFCREAAERALRAQLGRPLLGVCLGHQCIAHVAGAHVVRSQSPMHGKKSLVRHPGTDLFESIPSPCEVMRYHSLVVAADSLPSTLEATAHTEDGVVMAFAHRRMPIWGIQFHPESIGTPDGQTMAANFLKLSQPSTIARISATDGGPECCLPLT